MVVSINMLVFDVLRDYFMAIFRKQKLNFNVWEE